MTHHGCISLQVAEDMTQVHTRFCPDIFARVAKYQVTFESIRHMLKYHDVTPTWRRHSQLSSCWFACHNETQVFGNLVRCFPSNWRRPALAPIFVILTINCSGATNLQSYHYQWCAPPRHPSSRPPTLPHNSTLRPIAIAVSVIPLCSCCIFYRDRGGTGLQQQLQQGG